MSDYRRNPSNRPQKRRTRISPVFWIFLIAVSCVGTWFIAKATLGGTAASQDETKQQVEALKKATTEKQAAEAKAKQLEAEVETLKKEIETLKQVPAPNTGGETSNETSGDSNGASSTEASSDTTGQQESQPEDSQEAVVTPANGTGKNHNQAANAYAYHTGVVRAASEGGKQLEGKKIAFLTFDDGLSSKSTPLLLDKLKELGVPATHFVLGNTIGTNTSPYLKRMYEEGHAIAMHSFNHNYDKLYPGRSANANEIVSQAKQSLEAMQSVLGADFDTKVWRYPGGHMSWKNLGPADKALLEMGAEWIDWNSLNGDAEPKKRRPTTANGLVELAKKTIKNSTNPDIAVILMHDASNKATTREGLPALVEYLKSEGYTFGVLE